MGEKDYDNRTALHVVGESRHMLDIYMIFLQAASLNKPEIVAYLLQCGLNPHEKDDFGITPMDEAKRRNLQNLMDMMAEHQALTNNDEVFHLEWTFETIEIFKNKTC